MRCDGSLKKGGAALALVDHASVEASNSGSWSERFCVVSAPGHGNSTAIKSRMHDAWCLITSTDSCQSARNSMLLSSIVYTLMDEIHISIRGATAAFAPRGHGTTISIPSMAPFWTETTAHHWAGKAPCNGWTHSQSPRWCE